MGALASVSGLVDGLTWPRLKWRIVGLLPRPFRFDVQVWLTDRCFEKALRTRSSGHSWYAIESEWNHELYEIWDARCQFNSAQLIARANRLMVKVPSRVENDKNWTQSTFNGEWHLTLDGIACTRAMVREEERLQREERKLRAETSRVVLVSIALGSIYPAVQCITFLVEWSKQ